MTVSEVRWWHVGLPGHLGPGDGVVAFTANELQEAAPHAAIAVGFHEAICGPVPRAPRVQVHVPPYRPKRLIPVLAWLATRIGQDGCEVSWHLDKRQGPDSVRKLLEGHGWTLEKKWIGRTMRLQGQRPTTATFPEPRSFTATLGNHQATLLADYGVFSPNHVDEGTALLLDVALRYPAVETVADIGIGYGPLAIGLVLNSLARSAIGTDVDYLALWLAQRNAQAHDVPLKAFDNSDLSAVESTPLTVCNIPTHINAEQTGQFMGGLARRAGHGTLLVVVHASLEVRYTRHLTNAGLNIRRHPGNTHVVLEGTR